MSVHRLLPDDSLWRMHCNEIDANCNEHKRQEEQEEEKQDRHSIIYGRVLK